MAVQQCVPVSVQEKAETIGRASEHVVKHSPLLALQAVPLFQFLNPPMIMNANTRSISVTKANIITVLVANSTPRRLFLNIFLT
jgi:hypothetical protein